MGRKVRHKARHRRTVVKGECRVMARGRFCATVHPDVASHHAAHSSSRPKAQARFWHASIMNLSRVNMLDYSCRDACVERGEKPSKIDSRLRQTRNYWS